MKIQVLGSGCTTCKKLFELTKRAVEEMELKTEVEYVTDIQKIVEMGVMSSPVLAIDNKPIIAGLLPNIEKIKEAIKSHSNTESETASGCCADKNACDIKCKSDENCENGCSCGDNC